MDEAGGVNLNSAALVAVVEDTESVRRAVARLLASADFRVRDFASAEDYTRAEISAGVSCLILDIDLGGGENGLDLYERLLAEGRTVPVVFMTANDDPLWRQRARRFEAKAYLLKPFEFSDLLDAVAAATGTSAPAGRVEAARGDLAFAPFTSPE